MEAVLDPPVFSVGGNIPWHQVMMCPYNDLPSRSLVAYAMTYRLIEEIPIPGHEPVRGRRSKLATRLVLRRAFRAMWMVHRRGLSMGGRFSGSNFMVDDELSVWLTAIETIGLTKDMGDKDYFQFVKVILDDFFFQEQIPRDVLRWLRLISNGMEGCAYLICYHSNMMEFHQAITSHMSLYSLFLELETSNFELFQEIIDMLPQYNGWQDHYSYCINELMNDARTYTDRQGNMIHYQNDVRGVLKLVRHCWQHPGLFFEEFFTLIVSDDFPWLLADFQEAMYEAGLLRKLHLEATMR
ncbi:unnamed protein product [Urochloa humidicola]